MGNKSSTPAGSQIGQQEIDTDNKTDAELRLKELESEGKKMGLAHQQKMAELMVGMKQNYGALVKTYMDIMKEIIAQNVNTLTEINKTESIMTNDKLPESVKKTAEKNYTRLYNGVKSPDDLLKYARDESIRLQIHGTEEFKALLNDGVDKHLLTSEDKAKLLSN